MNTPISINIPRIWVYPHEFAYLEKVSPHTVYKWKEQGKIEILPKTIRKGCKRAGGKIQIKYLKYKEEQTRQALGHSNFVFNITGEDINVPDEYILSKRSTLQ
jgi:hypothetical protein